MICGVIFSRFFFDDHEVVVSRPYCARPFHVQQKLMMFLSRLKDCVGFVRICPHVVPAAVTIIGPLRFQAGCRSRRLNLALVLLCLFCVVVHFF